VADSQLIILKEVGHATTPLEKHSAKQTRGSAGTFGRIHGLIIDTLMMGYIYL